MVSFGLTREETREDQRLYTEARLAEVGCGSCAAVCRVKKNSEHHTSIQWDEDSLAQCVEFAAMAGAPGGRHVYAACSALGAAIDRAVADGALEVGALDGY